MSEGIAGLADANGIGGQGGFRGGITKKVGGEERVEVEDGPALEVGLGGGFQQDSIAALWLPYNRLEFQDSR